MMMEILSINIIHHFYHQKIMKMYLLDQNMINQNEELVVTKTTFIYFLLIVFEWQVSL